MIIECELKGGPFDGRIVNAETDSSISKGLSIAIPRMVDKEEDKFEMVFYKRDNYESEEFSFNGSRYVD